MADAARAGITALFGYLVVALWVGPPILADYLTRALPEVSRTFHTYPWNLSIWTSGERILGGMDGGPPLLPQLGLAAAAPYVSLLAAICVLTATLWAVRRPMRLEWALGIGLLLSIVVNPIAWEHYFILALIPGTLVVDWLFRHGLPARMTQGIGFCFLSLGGYPALAGIVFALGGMLAFASGGRIAIEPSPVTVLLIPLNGMLVLTWLTISIARRDSAIVGSVEEDQSRSGEPRRHSPIAARPVWDRWRSPDSAA